MKKILLGLFVVLVLGANAQIEKGNIFVGGSFGLSTSGGSEITIIGGTTTEVDETSYFGFSIIPQVGYMITEKIGTGIGVGYDYTKTTVPDFFDNGTDLFDQIFNNGTILISPFARYYKNVSEKLYFFGELNFPVEIESQKSLMWNANFDGVVDNDVSYSSLSYGFGLGLGAHYFVSNNVALEVNFNLLDMGFTNYKSTIEEPNGDKEIYKDSFFYLNFDTNDLINIGTLQFGVKIFF